MNSVFSRLLILVFLIAGSSIKGGHFNNYGIEETVVLKDYYQIAGCGNLMLAAAYKFSSTENDSTRVGIIRCPDMDGEGFYKVGEKYLVQKTNVNITDSLKDYLVNNYPQGKDILLF